MEPYRGKPRCLKLPCFCISNSCSIALPNVMILLSWNWPGLGNPKIVQDLCLMTQDKLPNLIFIIETKTDRSKLDWVKRRLGFEGCLAVNSLGRKGGLALIWKNDSEVKFESYSQTHLAWVEDTSLNTTWLFTGIWGEPEASKRHFTWNL